MSQQKSSRFIPGITSEEVARVKVSDTQIAIVSQDGESYVLETYRLASDGRWGLSRKGCDSIPEALAAIYPRSPHMSAGYLSQGDKYRAVAQLIHNEAGVTKEEIRAWLREIVALVVENRVTEQSDSLENYLRDAARDYVKIRLDRSGTDHVAAAIREAFRNEFRIRVDPVRKESDR